MTDEGKPVECALWYKRFHRMDYDLFDSEEEAATTAVYLVEDGTAAPVGVQFADGRTVKVELWDAYRVAEQRRWQSREELRTNPPQKRPSHLVLDPFEGKEVEVEDAEPTWIGRPST